MLTINVYSQPHGLPTVCSSIVAIPYAYVEAPNRQKQFRQQIQLKQ